MTQKLMQSIEEFTQNQNEAICFLADLHRMAKLHQFYSQ
jgi:hypothetical protein